MSSIELGIARRRRAIAVAEQMVRIGGAVEDRAAVGADQAIFAGDRIPLAGGRRAARSADRQDRAAARSSSVSSKLDGEVPVPAMASRPTQSWMSSRTSMGRTSPKSPLAQPASSASATSARTSPAPNGAPASAAAAAFASDWLGAGPAQRAMRRRRRRPALLPLSGSRPFEPSGPRSMRITGRMMTVAGSVLASTYLPPRAIARLVGKSG